MTLQEIREAVRLRGRDFTIEDNLWKDSELNYYINKIYWDIASKTKCIRDSTTAAVCLISNTPVDYTTYSAGTLDYIWANDSDNPLYHLDVAPYLHALHKSILSVEDVKWADRYGYLTHVSSRKWKENATWEQVTGQPTEYATDLESKKLALNYRDTEDHTLQMTVKRLPLTKLVDNTDEPEFSEAYHELFTEGVLWLMFSRPDSESFDEQKAAKCFTNYQRDVDEVRRLVIHMENRMNVNSPMRGNL